MVWKSTMSRICSRCKVWSFKNCEWEFENINWIIKETAESINWWSAYFIISYIYGSAFNTGSFWWIRINLIRYLNEENLAEISRENGYFELSCSCVKGIRWSGWGNIIWSSWIKKFVRLFWTVAGECIWTCWCEYWKWSCFCGNCLNLWWYYAYFWRTLHNIYVKIFRECKTIWKCA